MAGSQFLYPSSNGELYKSNYSRFASIQKFCCSVLSSPNPKAKGFNVQVTQNPMIDDQFMAVLSKEESLSFRNGDWWQAVCSSPLMPFISTTSASSSVNLASFQITDLDMKRDRSYKPGQQVNVSGVLWLQISSTRTSPFSSSDMGGFQMEPGFSLLSLLMEGIYMELPDGESRICLLGSIRFPVREKNTSEPWDHSSTFSPHLSNADNQIMANFSFPARVSLLNRAVVTGTIASLRWPDDGRYFDPVELNSRLDSQMKYEFESGDSVKIVCTAAAEVISGDQSDDLAYRGENFCSSVLKLRASYNYMVPWMPSILLDLNCPLSEAECTSLGPFLVDGEVPNGTHLLMQGVRCVEFDREGCSGPRANVSAVLRAVLPSQLYSSMADERTGLDNLTLVMEGEWSKASRKLCLIGCRNDHNHAHSSSSCDTMITIYIPSTLSLK